MRSTVHALPSHLPQDVRDRLWAALASAGRSDAALTERAFRLVAPIVVELMAKAEKQTRDLMGMAAVAFFGAGCFCGALFVAFLSWVIS